MIPRFTLTSAAIPMSSTNPKRWKTQKTIVIESLTEHPQAQSLERVGRTVLCSRIRAVDELGSTHYVTNCFKFVDIAGLAAVQQSYWRRVTQGCAPQARTSCAPYQAVASKLLWLRNNPRTLLNRLAGRKESARIRNLV